MRLVGRFAMFLLCCTGPALAEGPAPPAIAEGQLCRNAIQWAERGGGLPNHLLAAMGRVESGRRDPVTGDWYPWPWTVNAEGASTFYATKAQAVAAVRAMQSRGMRSIDVGCLQVNLMYHPDAFATLDLAFEPRANVGYAARFLRELYGQAGDWAKAAALYHSATPGLGSEYGRKVNAVLPLESRFAVGAGPSALARAWAATMGPATGGVVVGADRPRLGHAGGPRAAPIALGNRPSARSRGG